MKKLYAPKLFFFLVIASLVLAPSTHIAAQGAQSDCVPGSGWKAGPGPEQPQAAIKAEAALAQIGVSARIQARSYGEIDSCGVFFPQSIDYQVEILGIPTDQSLAAELWADAIQTELNRNSQPATGNLQITFPDRSVIRRSGMLSIDQNRAPLSGEAWTLLTPASSPSGRYIHGTAYDSHRSVVILFGGDNTGSSRLNDTWEFDGVNWQQKSPTLSPSGRVNIDQAMAYDAARQRVVLFGGLTSAGHRNDTWEYDGSTWTQVTPATMPGARDSHAIAYDSARQKMILFGGYHGGPLNDTWEYNGSWNQVTPATTPPARWHHVLTFDERRGVIVMFGGYANGSRLNDTWEFDGADWRQVTPLTSPPVRENHSMTYDSARGVVVMFGGLNSGGSLNDTWEYDGITWTQVTPTQPPAIRGEMALVYDRQNNRSLFFGGGYWSGGNLITYQQTWIYTAPPPTKNWSLQDTADSPLGRYLHGMAYDDQRGVMVLFGGDHGGADRLNDTWEFDGVNWQQMAPAQSPPGRVNIDQAMAYDSSRQRTVLFGGLSSSGYLTDTWEYDGSTWAQVASPTPPAARDAQAMAYDNHRQKMVMFGGYRSDGLLLNDTWEYNGSWMQIFPASSPSARLHHTLAYDERRGVMVLFGGYAAGSQLNDTWEFDGVNWHQAAPSQSPPARENHSMAYDNARGVILLFGGLNSSGSLNDTWEYNGTTWVQVFPDKSPTPRGETSLVYDRQRSQMVFYGGGYWTATGLVVFRETWVYRSGSTGSAAAFSKKVYVIIYNPLLSNGKTLIQEMGWNNPQLITQQTVDFFRLASHNLVDYQVVETTVVNDEWPVLADGFQYTEATFMPVINHTQPGHQPEGVSYNAIVNSARFDICGKANRNEIDEVWIYNGPYFGFYESTLVGPGAYWYNSPPVPGPFTCNRLIPIMGPSPERTMTEAVHNFGHRTESTMRQVYGSWEQNRTAHNWDRFGLVDFQSPAYNYSGCGSTHYPPNGTSDYDYGNPGTTQTTCDDFANYPNLGDPATTAQPVTCSRWGCTETGVNGYAGYWFGHLPYFFGCADDQKSNNWWIYFANPAQANQPSNPCQANAAMNHELAGPGSYILVTGENLAPNHPVTLQINGQNLDVDLHTTPAGGLLFILDTSLIQQGIYHIRITANILLDMTLTLSLGQPQFSQEGIGPVILLPSDISNSVVYLPMVKR